MVESGKNKESVEITIPVVDDIPATSQSETASNGVATKHSEGLRRRPSSARRMMEESDSAAPQNELLLKRPSSNGRTKYTQTKSRVMEVEPTSPAVNSNLSRQSSGKEASSSFSKTCLSGRIESFNKPGALPPAHDHHKDEADDDDDDRKQQDEKVVDEKNVKGENPPLRKKTKKKGKITLVNIIGAVEWAIFVGVVAFLVASLCVDKLKNRVIWGLEIWKWCVLAAVFFCGHLVTQWAKDLIVFLIENKYFFNEKVVYFVHGMKQSVRVVIWLSLVFLAWFLLIDLRGGGGGGKRSRKTTRVLNYVTKALAGCLIGAVLWMIKTLLVKSIAASFHVKTFFSKIREAISHEYVLWTLSLPPKSTDSSENGGDGLSTCLCFKIPKWRKSSKGSKEKKEEEITIKKLGKMKAGKMPVSTMGHLIDRIRSSKLSIISSVLDDSPGLIGEQKQITSTPEVEDAASQIFHNVKNPNQDYIEDKDLLPFMNEENVDCLLEWFEKVAQDGKISEEALKNWALIVEEMDILKTTFLRYDNEIIYYPNSVLATKAISNFNRSPERMGDSVNFDIDVFTSPADIQSLRAKIKEYVEENSQYWHPNHSVQVKEIENMNKMKMVLFVNHKMNFQNFLEKMNRRTELMLALKVIFEDLGIRYHLLPQEVQISHVGPAVPATSTPAIPSRISVL